MNEFHPKTSFETYFLIIYYYQVQISTILSYTCVYRLLRICCIVGGNRPDNLRVLAQYSIIQT